ncbi:hypothetical protein AVEN_85255-1 [Araneus ventricosus]|uniref:Uncharacterized protein n=1 Tax=Araneus ventricosus TaxID=182803 RepID=A0A4Y2PPX5_ARAVE|nr:hypothetical protein AVEN_78816-1 [Araneus ventricosus]GBN49948.1 hypothetical protein AVEN_253880-1 [Araneus ventricosus]GBN52297.1 hypothetical protein AVEN_253827-1 [Araneus ventricosus]GBN52313.1 hypothetical protein AVEN_85255-1 [Araneus ventricosus]
MLLKLPWTSPALELSETDSFASENAFVAIATNVLNDFVAIATNVLNAFVAIATNVLNDFVAIATNVLSPELPFKSYFSNSISSKRTSFKRESTRSLIITNKDIKVSVSFRIGTA